MSALKPSDVISDLSLDSPRRWRWIDYAGVAFVVLLMVAVSATAFVWSERTWNTVPTPAAAHPMALALICTLTSYLLFNHAAAHHDRAYLILACGYLTVVILFVVRALSTDAALVADRRLLGTDQTALWALVLARMVFAGILLWTICQFMWDRRRPTRHHGRMAVPVGIAVSVGFGLALGFVSTVPGLLPDLQIGTQLTTVYQSAIAFQIGLTCAVTVVAIINLRRGSFMARWLFVVSLVLLTDAAISVTATQRYQYGWYLQMLLMFAALTFLLCALIWQLARVDRALQRLVRTDPLTGLASRQQLLAVLQQEMSHTDERPVCAVWLDLDGFKLVNDRLGHSQGDVILAEVSTRLHEGLGKQAVIGRLGGDEFGVVVPGADIEQGVRIARELQSVIEEPITHDGAVTTLSATFGVACAPDDGDRAESLLQRADEAMYVGKAQGRRRITVFEQHMHMWARSNAQHRHDLAQAIAEGELTVWFQPIQNALSGSAWGCEALVRWQRDGVVIPAEEFVPFAQTSGQIREIGLFTAGFLRSALSAVPEPIAHWYWTVNVSAPELDAAEMVARLESLIRADPHIRVVLEITEEVALAEHSAAEAALVRLHDAGAMLAIDDFGAGFSNFAVLERLQPEIVKIDRSLVVKAVEDNSRAQTFVAASIAIAHSLGAQVVAEGVEDERSRVSLIRMGVDLLQGHYVGRPAPLNDVIEQHLARIPVLDRPQPR